MTSTPVPASTIQHKILKKSTAPGYLRGRLIGNDRATIKVFIKNKGNTTASSINLIIDILMN